MDIIIDHIWKTYGETTVLSDFSLTLAPGSRWALMAPSGTGKTTLLRLLLGLERPDRGQILGVPECKSVLFQEDRLFPGLSAVKNLCMAVSKCTPEQARQLLTELGLQECLNQPAATLSGGQARRVALARALAHPGELLALDEPFSGLDEASRRQAAQAIRRHCQGRTLLLITHREEDLPLLDITNRISL